MRKTEFEEKFAEIAENTGIAEQCRNNKMADTLEKLMLELEDHLFKNHFILKAPISIRPTVNDHGYVIEDSEETEHFFYGNDGEKMTYDGFCSKL